MGQSLKLKKINPIENIAVRNYYFAYLCDILAHVFQQGNKKTGTLRFVLQTVPPIYLKKIKIKKTPTSYYDLGA